MEAEIVLDYDDNKDAEAIAKAVAADNTASYDLSVKTSSKGNKVMTYIKCNRKMSTFIASIDDLFFCTSIAERTLRTAKKFR